MIFRDPFKLRVYIRPGRTDMRKAINGLLGVVNQSMKLNSGDEAIFLFCGRSRRVIKMLYWDGNGAQSDTP